MQVWIVMCDQYDGDDRSHQYPIGVYSSEVVANTIVESKNKAGRVAFSYEVDGPHEVLL